MKDNTQSIEALPRATAPASKSQRKLLLAGLVFTCFLAACGGGDKGTTTTTTAGTPAPTPAPPPPAPANAGEASRFLGQATMGTDEASVNVLKAQTYEAWLNAQYGKPQSMHLPFVTTRVIEDAAKNNVKVDETCNDPYKFVQSFWKNAVEADDQLRQRVAFALSQIFVVSFTDSNVYCNARGIADYYDRLGKNAFGNYRDLLEEVSLHPMMGVYLSHLRNQKASGNRVPDENYAREVMQLFSIGLYELNPDGTQKLGSNGKPIETYTNEDIKGLAKVFTGWSWYAGPAAADLTDPRFYGYGDTQQPNRQWTLMQNYPKFHSTEEKKFLGVTVPAQGTADGRASLKIALDRLANHPNVGPFIGKQLIQRLVTSNPSPAYVSRVSAAFNAAPRGDMKRVITAVLMDPEARNMSAVTNANAGKLREPVLRLSHWMRSFKATSHSGFYAVGDTNNPVFSLAQTPMQSPSVFNFWRPGYVPPNTEIAKRNLVAPEMQITHESSVVGYVNYMSNMIANGGGDNTTIKDANGNNVTKRDIQPPSYSAEVALAAQPDQLVDRVSLLLTANTMSADVRKEIVTAVAAITIPAPNANNSNAAQIDAAKKNRVYTAVLLTLASADYLAQR